MPSHSAPVQNSGEKRQKEREGSVILGTRIHPCIHPSRHPLIHLSIPFVFQGDLSRHRVKVKETPFTDRHDALILFYNVNFWRAAASSEVTHQSLPHSTSSLHAQAVPSLLTQSPLNPTSERLYRQRCLCNCDDIGLYCLYSCRYISAPHGPLSAETCHRIIQQTDRGRRLKITIHAGWRWSRNCAMAHTESSAAFFHLPHLINLHAVYPDNA